MVSDLSRDISCSESSFSFNNTFLTFLPQASLLICGLAVSYSSPLSFHVLSPCFAIQRLDHCRPLIGSAIPEGVTIRASPLSHSNGGGF